MPRVGTAQDGIQPGSERVKAARRSGANRLGTASSSPTDDRQHDRDGLSEGESQHGCSTLRAAAGQAAAMAI